MRDRLALERKTEQLNWRLANWRRTHRPPAQVHRALWDEAVQLAARQGVARTAQALRLDHAELRDAVAGLAREPEFMVSTAAGLAGFFSELGIAMADGPAHPVDLSALSEAAEVATAEPAEVVLELDALNGARVRIEARNLAPTTLRELVRALAG